MHVSAARHLHLVGAEPATTRCRGIPAPSLFLSDEESRSLRAAIRNVARARYGTLGKLAAALGVKPSVLTRKHRASPALAVALWRLTGTPLDTLLRPTLAAVPAPAPEGGTS